MEHTGYLLGTAMDTVVLWNTQVSSLSRIAVFPYLWALDVHNGALWNTLGSTSRRTMTMRCRLLERGSEQQQDTACVPVFVERDIEKIWTAVGIIVCIEYG